MDRPKVVTTFTPGPWTANVNAPDYDRFIVYGGNRAYVGDVHDRADARLIAAAPEMYEALNECATLLGRPNGPHTYFNGYHVSEMFHGPCGACGTLDRARAALAKAQPHAFVGDPMTDWCHVCDQHPDEHGARS